LTEHDDVTTLLLRGAPHLRLTLGLALAKTDPELKQLFSSVLQLTFYTAYEEKYSIFLDNSEVHFR